MRTVEVLVVGGGPAGLSIALALRRCSLTVAVLERAASLAENVGEVLPPAIIEPLSSLDLWDEFNQSEHMSSAGVSAWWGSHWRRDWDYIRVPYGRGWHIDRSVFENQLLHAARQSGAVIQYSSNVLCAKRCRRGKWTIDARVVDGTLQRWSSKFLVHAAGRANPFREITGQRVRYDQLVALSRYYRIEATSLGFEPRLWIEATPEGWWYSAPLPNGRFIAAFLTDVDYLRPRCASLFDRFLSFAPATRQRLSGCCGASETRVSRAESSHVQAFSGSGFLTLGDAAFTTDPARGHGILNALRQAIAGAEAIAEYFRRKDDAILRRWAHNLEAGFSRYLRGLTIQYRTEMRWPNSRFWARRHMPLVRSSITRRDLPVDYNAP